MKLFATLTFLALLFCYASAQCTVSLNAVRQGTWVDNGQNRSIWTVTIAAGQLQVSNVFLNIVGDLNDIWEVTLVNGTIYQLPAWRLQIGGISPGQSHVFGFIINNANTASPVSLISVVCPNVSPSPTPSAGISPSSSPSASVSPSSSPSAGISPSSSPSAGVSPSASPASPSASPSAGVCSLVVSQTARSGAGGSWSDNSFRFQIYDITTTNNGTRTLNAASVTFNIAADQVITQFWNFVRVGSTNTFTIPSFLLPAPGTTQDGLGYVLRTPLNSTSDGSSIGAVTFAC